MINSFSKQKNSGSCNFLSFDLPCILVLIILKLRPLIGTVLIFYLIPDTWYLIGDTWYLIVLNSWYLKHDIWYYLILDIILGIQFVINELCDKLFKRLYLWYLVLDTWYLILCMVSCLLLDSDDHTSLDIWYLVTWTISLPVICCLLIIVWYLLEYAFVFCSIIWHLLMPCKYCSFSLLLHVS